MLGSSGSSSGSGSSEYSSGSDADEEEEEEEGEGSGSGSGSVGTPDMGSPLSGRQLQRRRRRRDRLGSASRAASYDPGCACLFGFAGGSAQPGEPPLLEGGDALATGDSGEGGGGALLRQQLVELVAQPGLVVGELPQGRELSGHEWLEPHPWWADHLAHKASGRGRCCIME